MPVSRDSSAPITFVIPGQRMDGAATRAAGSAARLSPPMGLRGEVKASVRLGSTRAAGTAHRVVAVPGADMVVLHIADGPALVLHPNTARDLMLAQAGDGDGAGGNARSARKARKAKGTARGDDAASEVEVPAQLHWQGLDDAPAASARGVTRGILGKVVLKAVEVITGPLRERAEDFAADQIVARIDGQVKEGVYALSTTLPNRLKDHTTVDSMVAASAGAPTLVFIHGTFSDTVGSFGKLWELHHERVKRLFTHYGGRVYALDHATLGKSPIDNAYTLALACPPGARLHLMTHSRGGLVAEALARAAGLAEIDDAARELFQVSNLPGEMLKDVDAAGRKKMQAALDEQLRVLGLLIAHLRDQHIVIERVVRAACPARGTLLASQRFDAYISVFKWALDRAQIPVLPELVDFIGGVAQRRADPNQLPGVAAMIPDSPLVRWLHAAEAPVPGELRVIAGDLQGEDIGSWLKTLMADAFYWTDNDLVVQTRSMYGGAPRQAGASFVLDQGGEVSHFNYFSNELTAAAVVSGLTEAQPPGWRVIGPLSAAGQSAGGTRAAPPLPDPGKPAVFVLPGILGSHLAVDGKRIWLGWRLVNGLDRLAYPEPADRRILPDGAIGLCYDDLQKFLRQTHEVIEFSYDWRKPIEHEAQRLGAEVHAKLAARAVSGQPVRIVAHSMGGLVARTMQLECPDIWAQMMANPSARLLMLGTPNAGSWAPMQVLSGDDTFGNALVAFGAPFQDHQARMLMAQFPGFIQLQWGLLDDPRRLDRRETWDRLAQDDLAQIESQARWHDDDRQTNAYRWGVPAQPVLDAAVALRQRLDAQRDTVLPQFAQQMALVVGRATFTPDGYEIGRDGLVYLNSPNAGDGRVTLASAMLPGVPTWQLDCEHGSLPDAASAFPAYLDLLERGHTTRLAVQPPVAITRDGKPVATTTQVRSRPSRERQAPRLPPAVDDLSFFVAEGKAASAVRSAPPAALAISVINGDLKFVSHPLMLGHYTSSRVTGTEGVVDALIGGTMSQSLDLHQYPDALGTHQFFANAGLHSSNPLQLPRPQCVVVVGLGAEGSLRASDLAYTVKRGALALAQRILEAPGEGAATYELAATLIGSGGAGIGAAQAAQAIAQGVRMADDALADMNVQLQARDTARRSARLWPRIGRLHLIELYLSRASEAWRALHAQAQAAPERYALNPAISPGIGALRRPLDGGYRGSKNDYLRATAALLPGTDEAVVEYTVDTQKRARTERLLQPVQEKLLRALVSQGSRDDNHDAGIGRTLFNLLVPLDLEPFLGGSTELVLQVDRATAGIPWELLDTDSGARGSSSSKAAMPWAIRAKLIRTLTTVDYRRSVIDARPEAYMLVIGEPQCDPKYGALPGARAEARVVHELLKERQSFKGQVVGLIRAENASTGPDALRIINTLHAHNWRIVHIAGHGKAPDDQSVEPWGAGGNGAEGGERPRTKSLRGVVLSEGAYLGPCEIRSMRVVPELVFVNCCHLAGRSASQAFDAASNFDHTRFASGVAESLIEIGVRCVIAAGWAVDDKAAMAFATCFYEQLMSGRRFIDAVDAARRAAHAEGGNTWAAYQCYGDPDWRFDGSSGSYQRSSPTPADTFANVMSAPALALALETIAIECKHHGRDRGEQLQKIAHLQSEFALQWGGMGAVAEAFGVAWAAVAETDRAIEWYERAMACNDGSASMKASEQLGNLKARRGWKRRDAAAVAEALVLLRQLVALQPTLERHSLCGSACKRLAMIERAKGPEHTGGAARLTALREMQQHYAAAERIGREADRTDWTYPAMNRLAGELVLALAQAVSKDVAPAASQPHRVALDEACLETVALALRQQSRDAPDFWSIVGQTELHLYQAIANGNLASAHDALLREYDSLHARMKGLGEWDTVLDQLDFVLVDIVDPRVEHKDAAVTADHEAARALIAHIRSYVERQG